MRKNQKGRIPKNKTRERVHSLRDANYSYQEIADILKMKSRQLARYYVTYKVKHLTNKK
jgi:hypothetical protein